MKSVNFMNHKVLLFLFFFFGISHQFIFGQWSMLADSVLHFEGYWLKSAKIAPDRSIWVTTVPQPPKAKGDSIGLPKVHTSADFGKTWQHIDLERPGAPDISPLDRSTAFLAKGSDGLYKTLDGGRSWARVPSYPYESVFVHFFNVNEGWVLSAPHGKLGEELLKVPLIQSVTIDGGSTWTHLGGEEWNEPAGTSLPERDSAETLGWINFSNSKYDVRGDLIIFGTNQGRYWLSTDKGYHWKRYDTPLSKLDITAEFVSIKDKNTIVVVGIVPPKRLNEEGLGTGGCIVVATKDGGFSWTRTNPTIHPSSLEYIPGTEATFLLSGYITLSNGSHGSSITYDAGETWEFIDTKRIGPVYFLDENTGITLWSNTYFWGGSGPVYVWTNPQEIDSSKTTARYDWILLITLMVAVVIYTTYKSRDKSDINYNNQISSLRQSAEKANLSPKFVFNSLQAIQNLIKTGNKSMANYYLLEFAQFTRGVLQASIETIVPLEEDLSILRNYLSLEKLRLGERIKYHIEVEKSIDVYDTMVPSMVVQSVVENCINSTQRNAMQSLEIQISYLSQEDNLVINIDDNLQLTNETGQPGVETSGIRFIINQLKDIHKKSEMRVIPLLSDEGKIYGTRTHIVVTLV